MMTYTITELETYTIEAQGRPIAQVTSLEWARRIVQALNLLEASKKAHRIESYVEGIRGLAKDE